jgi:hypothetical protein
VLDWQASVNGAPRGMVPGMRAMYAEGGLVAFFRGNGANCLKVHTYKRDTP